MLSNSLLRMADCSRRVSLRFKSEVLDPLKTFNENYENIYEEWKKPVAYQYIHNAGWTSYARN